MRTTSSREALMQKQAMANGFKRAGVNQRSRSRENIDERENSGVVKNQGSSKGYA